MELDSNSVYISLGHIKEMLLRDNNLKVSAKINDYNDFRFSYYKSVDKALTVNYSENKELYKLLLSDEDVKKRVLGIYMEELYNALNKRGEDKNAKN